jgi:hypothetical protein
MPRLALEIYKQGKSQKCLYDVDDAALRSKSLEEVEHYLESGKFPEPSRKSTMDNPQELRHFSASVQGSLFFAAMIPLA